MFFTFWSWRGFWTISGRYPGNGTYWFVATHLSRLVPSLHNYIFSKHTQTNEKRASISKNINIWKNMKPSFMLDTKPFITRDPDRPRSWELVQVEQNLKPQVDSWSNTIVILLETMNNQKNCFLNAISQLYGSTCQTNQKTTGKHVNM